MSGFKVMRYVLLVAAAAYCQKFAGWSKSGTITIGTTPAWANYTGATIANYPLLVKLDSSVFNFAEADANGADVRFSGAAGTDSLAYEIEFWDKAKGKAAIWVKLASVAPNATQTIKMYWGKPGSVSGSNGAGVFPDYFGVWHLSEAASATINKDASGHGRDGTKLKDGLAPAPDASVVTAIPSPLGFGQLYNQTPENQGYTQIEEAKADLKNVSLTVSAWIKRDSINHGGDFFVSQGTQDPGIGLRLGFDFRNEVTLSFDGGQPTSDYDPYTKVYETLDWHQWVGTFNLSDKKASIYMDGKLDTTGTMGVNYTGHGPLDFGWAYGPSGEYFHPQGGLDEVRIMTSVASADAIKLTYLNQQVGQGLVSYPVTAACTEVFSASGPTAPITEGAVVELAGTAKCAQRFAWMLVDGTTETLVPSDGVRIKIPTRVSGNKTVKYRWKGMFAGVWKQQDISVTINEAIPEPIFTLASPTPKYEITDANLPLVLKPVISNLAAVTASSAPKINYKWSFSGTANPYTLEKPSDSLMLTTSTEGKIHVQLCLENGGPESCHAVDIDATTGIRPLIKGDARAFELKGSQLLWKQDATIMAWDLGGRLIFSKTGAKGDQFVLSPALLRAMFARDHLLMVVPNSKSGAKKTK
jgi:hypothetical protein